MEEFIQNHNGISGTLRFRITSDGCKDDISQRGLGGKCLHGTTEKVLSWKEKNKWDGA